MEWRGLREWYGNRGATKKVRRAATTSDDVDSAGKTAGNADDVEPENSPET